MIDKYFKAIIDNSPESIVLISKSHEVLAFNKTIKDVLIQYHNKEIKVGDLYYPDFVVESNRKLYLEAFQSAINGKPYYIQNLTDNENVSYWFEYKMQPVYDGKELLGVTLSAKNITNEKEAELKIIELSKKFKAILDNTDESITLLDLDYNILALNEIAKKNIQQNTNSDTYIGRDFRDFIPDSNNLFYKYYPKAVKGKAALIEISYKNSLDELIWYETKFNPVYDQDNKLIGVSIFAKDITTNKNLELYLNESEERFQKFTDLAPIGILITNNKFRINYANKFAKNLFGYADYEFHNMSIIDIIENFKNGDDHRLKIDNSEFEIDSPTFYQEKFVALTKNMEQLSIILSSSILVNEAKQNYIFIIQDITDINKKESIIQEQTVKLRDIAWYQSHAIRAPLARIMGIVELLENNLIDKKERNFFYKAILDSSQELDKVINNIIDKTH